MVDISREVPLIDELLEPYRRTLGVLFDGTRAHAYRMFNHARALSEAEPDRDDRLAIVAALHDVPVLLDGDLAYVERGGELAAAQAIAMGRPDWAPGLRLMAENHHKVRRYVGPHANLVEATRRADWIDASFTGLRFGLSRSFVREVARSFPMTGVYPSPALRLMARYAVRHPGNPLPMLRW